MRPGRKTSVPRWLFRGDRFAQTLDRVDALKKLCEPYFPTLAEAALRYTLSSPHVSTVIPGMLTPEEIDMNVAYADGQPFSVELLDRLGEHSWPRNFYK
jgi:aryl-alcohol dehydrogenase-like predicted oxidoreductase